jgi:signal transduction histidine kinase
MISLSLVDHCIPLYWFDLWVRDRPKGAGILLAIYNEYPRAEIEMELNMSRTAMSSPRLRLALIELGEDAIEHGQAIPNVVFRVDESDGELIVSVEDDGPGMPEIEQQVIKTGRETPLDHGQGLGLWLVNWIATESGGRVTTEVEDGTTVSLHLDASGNGDLPSSEREAALGHGVR